GSIDNYADIEKKVAGVAGVNGSDAYIVGQAMLSSGRGIGGVIVRGGEPNNPVVRAQWGRYMTAGGLDDLSRSYAIPGSGAQPAATAGGPALRGSPSKKLKAQPRD